jgi:hypothetical protein
MPSPSRPPARASIGLDVDTARAGGADHLDDPRWRPAVWPSIFRCEICTTPPIDRP